MDYTPEDRAGDWLTFRYLDILKHFIFSSPKIGAMVSSGVNHCLFSGSCNSFSLR